MNFIGSQTSLIAVMKAGVLKVENNIFFEIGYMASDGAAVTLPFTKDESRAFRFSGGELNRFQKVGVFSL